MEEKKKNLVAKKNELEILAKILVSMRKRCHRLEFVSISNTKGSEWYKRKTNHFRKGHKDTKQDTSEDKVDGNLDQWVQCDNCKKWRKLHSSTDISSLPTKWFCRLNIKLNHNSRDVPQEEEDGNNEDDDDGSNDDDDDGSNNDDDKNDDDDNTDDDEEEKEKEKEKEKEIEKEKEKKIEKENGDENNAKKHNDDDEEEKKEVHDDNDDGRDDDDNNNHDSNNTGKNNDDYDNNEDDDDGSNDDDGDGSNNDNDSTFKSSTVSIAFENKSESLLCDNHVFCDYRLSWHLNDYEILDETEVDIDAEINETQSDISGETLRKIKVFVQDERDMLNTEIFLPVVIEEVDDLKFEILTVEDLSTLQKSLDEVKGDADIFDDINDSNDDDDSTFQSNTISITVSNESESLLCDPHYDTFFRLLDRTDSESTENQSNCSSETLRQRKVFVEDERNTLNTEMFIPIISKIWNQNQCWNLKLI